MELIALIFGLFIIISLIMPWVNRSRINDLQDEVALLNKKVLWLHNATHKDEAQTQPKPKQVAETILTESVAVEIKEEIIKETPKPKIKPQELKEPVQLKEKLSFEQQFGARLPVWIGGIALALAGFFMVKYSIETGLLSPVVRVVLGIAFGIGMLYAANWLRAKPNFANGERISQALSGAGIADLYVCIFAATNLYQLVPSFVGFAGMAAVTATAVILSIRHGMPIALLGLVGGFLTPAMIGSNDPQAPILFIYLYFVLTGLMVVICKQRWWGLAIPTVLGGFLWVCLWTFGGNFHSSDVIYLGLFLIAISATVISTSRKQYEEDAADISDAVKVTSALNYLTIGGALIIMATIAGHAGFGFMEWALFGLLSLGGIALAFFNQKLYGFVPWVSIAVNAIMLLAWSTPDANAFALTVGIFALIYIASGYLLQSRSRQPLTWGGLTAAASLGYYLLAFAELRRTGIADGIPLFWGGLALVMCGLAIYALKRIITDVPESHGRKQHLMAIYATTATAFLSIALTIELPREFLSVAIAGQLFAIALINLKLDVKALRYIIGVLGCVFAVLLAPQIILLVQLTAYSLVEAKLHLQDGLPIVNWPAFQLGLPALFFAQSSYFLRLQHDSKLVRALEVAAIAMIGVMGYYLTRHAFHPDDSILFIKAGFIERGIITNAIFVYGLACLLVGRKFSRVAISTSGLVLCGIAIFRIIYFDLIAYNPYWAEQAIGELPIFNALLLTYGLAILWTWRATKELPHIGKAEWVKYGAGFMLLLAFVLVSLNVRQIFHGTYLNGYETSNAEIYTYSVVWLLFGVALLFFGTLRKDKMIRVASLGVMILTVGKVFIYDASELEGLFRVFSGLIRPTAFWFPR
jgi:uncharacterized membrane protein